MELVSLAKLTRVEGTARVAAGAGLTEQQVHRLRSGFISNSAATAVDILTHMSIYWSFEPGDIEKVLNYTCKRSPNVVIEQLLDLKASWPQLDLERTILDMTAGRDRRAEAKKA